MDLLLNKILKLAVFGFLAFHRNAVDKLMRSTGLSVDQSNEENLAIFLICASEHKQVFFPELRANPVNML